MKLSKLIKDNFAYFDSYRAGFFYYHLLVLTGVKEWMDSNNDIQSTPEYDRYQFTIPREDFENATLNKREKAITLTKWISKALDNNELIKLS